VDWSGCKDEKWTDLVAKTRSGLIWLLRRKLDWSGCKDAKWTNLIVKTRSGLVWLDIAPKRGGGGGVRGGVPHSGKWQKIPRQFACFGIHSGARPSALLSCPYHHNPSCCSYLTLFSRTPLGKQPSVINRVLHPHNLWPHYIVHSPTNVSLKYSQKLVLTKHVAGGYIVREGLFWGGTQQDGRYGLYCVPGQCLSLLRLTRRQSLEHHALTELAVRYVTRGVTIGTCAADLRLKRQQLLTRMRGHKYEAKIHTEEEKQNKRGNIRTSITSYWGTFSLKALAVKKQ
jgi:hypothetical protein